MRHPNVNSTWILSFQPELADVFLACHRHCGSAENIRAGPAASPQRFRPAPKMLLRLHDLAGENIQLTIFLFSHFRNLEGTNLIAAYD